VQLQHNFSDVILLFSLSLISDVLTFFDWKKLYLLFGSLFDKRKSGIIGLNLNKSVLDKS
jgi:hypothetical protein